MTTPTPLRIVHTESSCGWGGQEIRILSEMQGMQALGHSLHLLCSPQSTIYQEAHKLGIPMTALPIERKSLKGLQTLRQWLKNNPADVINTHSSTDSWLVALARLGRSLPVVRTRHVSAPIKASWATHWLYTQGCDYVVTTGEGLRNYVVEQTRLAANRVQSIPTGIDLTRFKSGDVVAARNLCNLPNDKTIIGIVATLRSWKGHQFLLEAVAQLQCPDLLVLIVGDGPNLPNIEQTIQSLNLQNQVQFAGNQTDVVPWLQAMDLFVLPSYANEGVPQSLMQAMACGLAVISTPIGSIAELVIDQQTGRLVPPRDSQTLAQVIAELLDNTDKRQQLAQAGQKFVQECYSLTTMVEKMQAVFYQVVKHA